MMMTPPTDTSLPPSNTSLLRVPLLTSSTRLSNISGLEVMMFCSVKPLNTIAAPEMPGPLLEQTLEEVRETVPVERTTCSAAAVRSRSAPCNSSVPLTMACTMFSPKTPPCTVVFPLLKYAPP